MTRFVALLTFIGISALALVLGLFGMSLLFSDFGPNEPPTSRVIVVIVFYAMSGALLGFISPRRWMLSGLVAWGALLLAIGSLLSSLERGVEAVLQSVVLFAPLLLALGGGYAGRSLRSRWGR